MNIIKGRESIITDLFVTIFFINVLIAQLVEHKAENFGVVGSNPSQNT